MSIEMYILNVSQWSNCRYGEYVHKDTLDFTKYAFNFKNGMHKYAIYQHFISIGVKLNPLYSFYGYYFLFI